jgi:transglutaminase/protease-like cytokinesis protein 3
VLCGPLILFPFRYCHHLFLQLCLIMLNQNTHTYTVYRESGQIRRLSYRLQYFFISDSVKVKLCNNRLHNRVTKWMPHDY